jgi:hypothetical protein
MMDESNDHSCDKSQKGGRFHGSAMGASEAASVLAA